MAIPTGVAASLSCGSFLPSLHQHQKQRFSVSAPPASPLSFSQLNLGERRIARLNPVEALPLISIAADSIAADPENYEFISTFNDWTLDHQTLKNIYLAFSLFFCWGCCVFASMNDPFYDGDTYRGAGGDGTGNWIYTREDEEGVEAREELWREELAREIEERVGEIREIEESKKEKELA